MAAKKLIGNVRYRSSLVPQFTTTHGRYWMQNAPLKLIEKAYAQYMGA